MAPDTVARWLRQLAPESKVLDPMCGSGVVIRQSAMLGHEALGFDIDPLAVLMSRVWTRRTFDPHIRDIAAAVVERARRKNDRYLDLPWIAACPETQSFIRYWFAQPQRNHLARLVIAIDDETERCASGTKDLLLLTLSRIIVTKHTGASLAWDVSHSRPHKKRELNDFDVYGGFLRSMNRLAESLEYEPPQRSGKVRQGDCRNLRNVKAGTIDAVITSPPYLNAIDYLRGHKLSLVWMGYNIPELRSLRAGAVGTERAKGAWDEATFEVGEIAKAVRDLVTLPQRQRSIVHKYAIDANDVLTEMCRVLTDDGLMVLVLGDSNLRGQLVRTSKIFSWIAKRHGFQLIKEMKRPLAENRRYLPITSGSVQLSNRMKYEVVQAYRKVA
jgi:SAM-dependent methyltransferase